MTEYEKALFDTGSPKLAYKIARTYYAGEQWDLAVKWVDRALPKWGAKDAGVREKLTLLRVKTLLRNADYDQLLKDMPQAEAGATSADGKAQLGLMKGYALAFLDKPDEAKAHLARAVPASSPYRPEAARMTQVMEQERPSTKIPGVAATLSLLPGLGQAYAGFYKEAGIALVVNAVVGWFAYDAWRRGREIPHYGYAPFTAWMLLELPFYTGNMYNAARLTKQANDRAYRDYYKKVEGPDYARTLSVTEP